MSKNRNRGSNINSKKPEKTLLASANIKHGRDTNILEEDLYREFQKDKNNTDTSKLVNDTWVRFFNPDSSFLKGMMALVQNSTTTRNVISKKTSITMGDGFVPVASETVPFLQNLRKLFKLETENDRAIEELNTLIGNVNLNNETLEEVIEKVAFDWWAFGNAIVELKKTRRNGKEVTLIYHVPLDQVGIHKANNNNIIESIGVTSNWEIDGTDPTAITEVPLYPNFNSKGSSAIHIKNYAPGFFYWGLPTNVAARFWAEIEYRIPKYNISKFKNSFKPSAIIQAYGSFSPEEADELVESFKSLWTDTGNNDQLIVQVLNKKEAAADITVLEDKSEGNYIELQRLASQAIVTANEWTTSLAGIATSGKLGSNQQIRDELEFVINTTIKQGRRKIVQSIINPFIRENQEQNSALKGVMLRILNMNPISLASLIDPNNILTKNELRDIIGYDALDKEEEMEGQQANDQEPQNQ